jgi:F-type H+-transporting ATPase subunit gamma
MKTYLAHKNQMQGLKDVLETVKTVEKIAASSVHFLKQEVASLNSYAAEIEKILTRLSLFYPKENHPLLREKNTGKRALIVLTGDKGLVGGLWHAVVSALLENIHQYQAVISIGAKGEAYLKEEDVQIKRWFFQTSDIPQKQDIEKITGYIFGEFKKGTFRQVAVLYPQFISLAKQSPLFVSFLPFKFALAAKAEGEFSEAALGLPIFEPSKRKFFDRLLQKYIGLFFYKIVMEAKLSELSARTVAMEHAGAKTNQLIQKFTLDYAKERRRAITQRQLESFAVHKAM